MTKELIINAIREYIKDESAKYAVLIDGKWGSGKTYLYKNYLVDVINSIELGKNNRKTNIYISLYGISNIEALSKEVISHFLIYSKARGNLLVKKLYKPVEGVLDIATKAFSFSVGVCSADFSGLLERLEGMITVKDMVICFDDLERCNLPVNEFFGFVNNLVEHCNCKVIVLADEDNIGRVFANTNIELKYQTILTSDRKVVDYQENVNSTVKSKQKDDRELSIDELKRLNEKVFSENYIYRDVKEKVIGRTLYYHPDLKETLDEIINIDGVCRNNEYKEFLANRIVRITSCFRETNNVNLRIVLNWIKSFEDIFTYTKEEFGKTEYYDVIIDEFLRYSIWVASSLGKNKKIITCENYSNHDYVYYEGNEYNRIHRVSFIDAWIKRDVKDRIDLRNGAKQIIERIKREQIYNPKRKKTEGIKLSALREWHYKSDEEVKSIVTEVVQELMDNKYAYPDYSSIIYLLLEIEEIELLEVNLFDIQKIMLDLIETDCEVQTGDDYPIRFGSQEQANRYNELYSSIREKRNERNKQLGKEEIVEENYFESAEAFLELCEKRENYFLNHKSFTEYVNINDILKLLKTTDLEGIYDICRALRKIYHMSNVKDFYVADIENLVLFKNKIKDTNIIPIKGKTHKFAIEYLEKLLTNILESLGYEQ